VLKKPAAHAAAGGDFLPFSQEWIMHRTRFVPAMFLASQLAIPMSQSYIDFVSNGSHAVVFIELATPGSNDWKPVKLRGVTDGGYVSSTGGYIGHAVVAIDLSRGCLYDVRIEFAEQKALLIEGLDACHVHTVRINDLWQKASRLS
jgi:hypothetical protein